MKAIIEGVEVEGTATELAEFVVALKSDARKSDVAMLTPKQRVVYDGLAKHPNGAHYTALAEELGHEAGNVNSMLNALVHAHKGRVVERLAAGTFRAVVG